MTSRSWTVHFISLKRSSLPLNLHLELSLKPTLNPKVQLYRVLRYSIKMLCSAQAQIDDSNYTVDISLCLLHCQTQTINRSASVCGTSTRMWSDLSRWLPICVDCFLLWNILSASIHWLWQQFVLMNNRLGAWRKKLIVDLFAHLFHHRRLVPSSDFLPVI